MVLYLILSNFTEALDSTAVFTINHIASNIPVVLMISVLIDMSTTYLFGGKRYVLGGGLTTLLHVGAVSYFAALISGKAIRSIDPEWNKVALGKPVYPSIFRLFVKTGQEEETEDELEAESLVAKVHAIDF